MSRFPPGDLVRIGVPYACFGVILDPNTHVVIAAAPIVRWMLGRDAETCRAWVLRRGGQWERVAEATS